MNHLAPGVGFKGSEEKNKKGDRSAVSMINFMNMRSDCAIHEAGQESHDCCSDPGKFHSIRDDSFGKVLTVIVGGPELNPSIHERSWELSKCLKPQHRKCGDRKIPACLAQ